MPIIKLGLRDFTLTEKIQFARQIITAMTNNGNFPSPAPALASVTTAVGALENSFNEAQTARQAAQAKTSAQNDRSDELDLLLTQLANHVENTSGGDSAKIQSAGMSVRSAAAPIGSLSTPTDLTATEGDMEGEIDLSWNRVRGSKSYVKCDDETFRRPTRSHLLRSTCGNFIAPCRIRRISSRSFSKR